jgi:hypothetical protein
MAKGGYSFFVALGFAAAAVVVGVVVASGQAATDGLDTPIVLLDPAFVPSWLLAGAAVIAFIYHLIASRP